MTMQRQIQSDGASRRSGPTYFDRLDPNVTSSIRDSVVADDVP